MYVRSTKCTTSTWCSPVRFMCRIPTHISFSDFCVHRYRVDHGTRCTYCEVYQVYWMCFFFPHEELINLNLNFSKAYFFSTTPSYYVQLCSYWVYLHTHCGKCPLTSMAVCASVPILTSSPLSLHRITFDCLHPFVSDSVYETDSFYVCCCSLPTAGRWITPHFRTSPFTSFIQLYLDRSAVCLSGRLLGKSTTPKSAALLPYQTITDILSNCFLSGVS
jgi:hypothetical protein